jgi:cytochrome c peroxidase
MRCSQPQQRDVVITNPLNEVGTPLPPGLPDRFPAPQVPRDNYFTKDRIELGKEVFYTPIFSSDGKTSCATCHKPWLAFADTALITAGSNGRKGFRNAPSLVNIAWHPLYMYDGGVPTLELQVLAPFAGHEELDFNIEQAVEILNNDSALVALSKRAYDRRPDVFVITRGLACYLRTLIDGDSRYDRYLKDSVKNPLTESEKKGMFLFFSDKTGCASCHSGPFFSDFSFENIGLYTQYTDSGRARITFNPADKGKFKTPSLRNINITAPYMHNGSLKTLEDVVKFYETGGNKHPNKSAKMKKFTLTKDERKAMVDFLKSLTGSAFVNVK